MLRFWIVTSSLFVASFCEDVNFSFGETCYSEENSLKLTAVYTGSGTVTAVQWYYSGKTGSNMIVLANTCSVAGGSVPAGYPDESRMTFGCDLATKTFTLTLDALLDEELDKSWGATFSLSVGTSPDVMQKPISVCLSCKENCKIRVIVSIVFGIPGMIALVVVIIGIVKGFFNKPVSLGVDGLDFVFDIISLGLSASVLANCEDCEDWILDAAKAFVASPSVCAVGAIGVFFLVCCGVIGPGGNANEAYQPGENREMPI